MIRRLTLLFLLLWGGQAAAQTPVIRLVEAGQGIGPELLANALAGPHTVVGPDTGRFLISRGSVNRQTIIVLGRDVVVEGTVDGDVIVIAGDLYTHPGAAIRGSAVSLGGGVYESMLATISGPIRAFREFTYDIVAVPGGYELRYRVLEPPRNEGLSFGGIFGLSLPTYDRSNGLSFGLAPSIAIHGYPVVASAGLVYRSQLGQVDPTLGADLSLAHGTVLSARAGRETRSNDRWIRSDLVNSALFFVNGTDARNYYRATFVDARITKTLSSSTGTFSPYAGASLERARGVRPDSNAVGGPWTLVSRQDSEREHRRRPNAPIDGGTIASARLGAAWVFGAQTTTADARLDLEGGTVSGAGPGNLGTGAFGQATFDGGFTFPTFATQYIEVESHFVITAAGAPRQRFAYLGGSGTIPTMELLEAGGDQLVYFGGTYQIPLEQIQLPYVGSPVVGIREVIAGAGVGRLPDLRHAIGLRVSLKSLYGEYLFDPTLRRGHLGVGASFGR